MTEKNDIIDKMRTWGIFGTANEIRRLEGENLELRSMLRKHVDPCEIPPEQRTPEQAAEVALWEVERAGRVTRFVSELATMTDVEAEFLSGYAVRKLCRMLADDSVVTVPRIYGENDRQRAADEVRKHRKGTVLTENDERTADAVAEALGMRRA